MNEHQNVNKEYNLSSDTCYDLIPPPQTVSRLNNHVTLHIQSKVISWSCDKNKHAVLIPSLFPLLTWVSSPR